MDNELIPVEIIQNKIFYIRAKKVMLDTDLAELYGLETYRLNESVKRNIQRFPSDFMYELTDDEINAVVSQNVIPSKSYFGGSSPFAFTENGVAMLSSVLNSDRAIAVNIQIIRAFSRMRQMMLFQIVCW